MAAEIVYKKWFGGKRTKIVMGVLVFMLLAVASPLTAKVSKADTPAARNTQERRLIDEAKAVLMERNHMTEDEAHKYIQKCAMDSGTKLVESAQMVLSLYV